MTNFFPDSIIGIRDNSLEMKKSTTPIITLTNSDGKRACDNLINEDVSDPSGMLNLISNDLDYLLNRTQELPLTVASSTDHIHQKLPIVTPPPPSAFATNNGIQTVKSPQAILLHHDVIIEESEHEVDS